MYERSSRLVSAIDADLQSCRGVWRDARRELAEVRRRQAELGELEVALLAAIDIGSRRTDRLLDERLQAV